MTNGKKILELRRLALCEFCPKIIKLISYQDTEVHLGTIYKASNWKVGGETQLMAWDNIKRKRNQLQSTANKIRWEFLLRSEINGES